MDSIQFTYGSYYKRCRELGTPSDDVFGYVYTADYRAIKAMKFGASRPGQEVPAQPFLTRNMVARRLSDDDPILAADRALAPMGGYVVHEERPPDRRGKHWLFFVFPELKRFRVPRPSNSDAQLSDEHELVAADHFSFVVNHDAPERARLQLHRTQYVPMGWSTSSDVAVGWQAHVANHLPLAFDLPLEPRAFAAAVVRTDTLLRCATQMRAMLSEPLLAPPAAAASAGGSGRRPRRRATGQSAYRRLKLALRDEPIKSFDDVWTSLPLHRVTVLVVSRPGGMCDVTALLTDRLSRARPEHNTDMHALVMRLPSSVAKNPVALEAALAAQLARSYTWDSFDDKGDIPLPL